MKLAIAVFLASVAFAQAPKRIQFEVASVRPSLPNQGKGAITPAAAQTYSSQIRLTYLTLRDIVIRAYDVRAYQVTGPDWTMTERYDVIATLPEGSTPDQLPQMFQSLLEDRFGLKVHKTQKEFEVYRLQRGQRPFALKEVRPTGDPEGIVVLPTRTGSGVAMKLGRGASFSFTEGIFEGKGMSMQMLANTSSQFLNLPAVNQTGLNGFYDFRFELAPEDYNVMMMSAASKRGVSYPPEMLVQLGAMTPSTFFDALERVGLKMEKGKAMLDIVNIDEARQVPTEN